MAGEGGVRLDVDLDVEVAGRAAAGADLALAGELGAACRGYGSIIPDPCRECSGDGRVRSRRTLTVKIPAGATEGMQ